MNYFSLGQFIVDKNFRHKGYGNLIWQTAINYRNKINPNATIGLCSVPDQVSRYEKNGFKKAFINLHYSYLNSKPGNHVDPYIYKKIDCSILSILKEYDSNIYPASREKIFSLLIEDSLNVGICQFDQTQMVGYGFIRPCEKNYRIGPLVANSPENARFIFLELAKKIPKDEKIIIDIPSNNKDGIMLINNINLISEPNCNTQVMYLGKFPNYILANSKRNFGIFSLEMG